MRKFTFMLPLAGLGALALVAFLSLSASASASARLGTAGHRSGPGFAVTGTVMTSGKADPAIKVIIHAWPDQSVTQALRIGQKVPWVLVGTANTDASGHFSVTLPLAKLMPEASYGVVNLEADTSSAGETFPLAVTRNSGDGYLDRSDPVVNLTDKPGGLPVCGFGNWDYVASMGKHWATVGETYVPNSHARQRFSYTKVQSSTLGVGTSASGKRGSFSEHGTYSWSSSITENWPTFGSHRSVLYRTQFHFGEYRCSTTGTKMQHVNGYAGGAHIEKPTSVPHTPSRFCVGQIVGQFTSVRYQFRCHLD